MSVALVNPLVAELNGLPFLHDAFAGRRLLAMTAALRHAAARQRGLAGAIPARDAEAWLAPALAFALSTSATPLPALPLTAARWLRRRGRRAGSACSPLTAPDA